MEGLVVTPLLGQAPGRQAEWVGPGGALWGLPQEDALEAKSAGIPEAKIRRSADLVLLSLIKIIT